MFAKRFSVIALVLLGALALVACGAPGSAPGDEPTATPGAEQVAEEALPPARTALADYLGLDEDALELEKVEDAEWSDSCLGLGGPAESCLAAITPGYAITFDVNGESHVVRTDLEGNAVRVEAAYRGPAAGGPEGAAPEADLAAEYPVSVVNARQVLAVELGATLAAVDVVNFERAEWSDSCLGLGGPAESCLAAITPGWRVILSFDGAVYEVRTDEFGEAVRIAEPGEGRSGSMPPDPNLGDAVLFYERSGGIAGELVTVRVYPDGAVERTAGLNAPSDMVEAYLVAPAAVEQLLADLQEVGYFDLERDYLPDDTCCDRILYLISVRADGEVRTVEALGGTEATPETVWESVAIIETFLDEARGQ